MIAPATACLGVDFDLIGPEYDTSPRFPLEVYLVDPPGSDRFLDEVVHLLEIPDPHRRRSRFIAFVDSRKQVELISSILNRLLREDSRTTEAAAEEAARLDDEAVRLRPHPSAARWGKARPKPSPEDEAPDEPDPEGEVTGRAAEPERAALPGRVRRPRPPPDPGTAGGGHAQRGGFDQRARAGHRHPAPGYLRADRRAFIGHLAAAAHRAHWPAQPRAR